MNCLCRLTLQILERVAEREPTSAETFYSDPHNQWGTVLRLTSKARTLSESWH